MESPGTRPGNPRKARRPLATRSFTHLHTHTEFSMLDGAARVKDLVAGGGGRRAAGPRDHRPRQHVRRPRLLRRLPCRRHQPGHRHRGLHGRRVAARAPGPARARSTTPAATSAGGEKLYYHLTLLAETTEGYRNLLKLSSAAYLEGYYYKPQAGLGAPRAAPAPASSPPPAAWAGWCSRPCWPTTGSRPRRWPPASRTSSAGATSSWSCRTTGCPSSTRPTRPWWRSPVGSAPPCWPPTTATTPTARTTWPTTPCCASRPGPSSTTPSGSSSRVRSTT